MEKDLHNFFNRTLILTLMLFFLINLVNGQSIDVNYPDTVQQDQEFTVKLTLTDFEETSYDVKIDILGDGKRISKILNGNSWKSTFNYIKDVDFSESSNDFRLKITESYEGTANLEIKIRKESKTYTFNNYTINVKANNSKNNNGKTNKNTEESKMNENTHDNMVDNNEKAIQKKEVVNSIENINNYSIIRLNSKTQDIKNTVIYESNNEIIKKGAIYGFSVLLLVLIVLLLFKKI